MSVPPEVVFHRYFGTLNSQADRQRYKGKHDLAALNPPELGPFLAELQQVLTKALAGVQYGPEHIDQGPFHVDYVDSGVSNALAFRHDGYSFIGITIPLMYAIWDECHLLSRSVRMASRLGVRLQDEDDRDGLRVVLFRTTLFFVVLHEWTHHIHGHVRRRGSDSALFNEILDDAETGGLEMQAEEADSDFNAAYYVLDSLIVGPVRVPAVTLLGLDGEPVDVQDEVLVSCFIVAVGAFLFVRPPAVVNRDCVYKNDHPPQAARMLLLIYDGIAWCKRQRPGLEARLAPDCFHKLMDAVAQVTWGVEGGIGWAAQATFLLSPGGLEYLRQLDEHRAAHVRSLSRV